MTDGTIRAADEMMRGQSEREVQEKKAAEKEAMLRHILEEQKERVQNQDSDLQHANQALRDQVKSLSDQLAGTLTQLTLANHRIEQLKAAHRAVIEAL